jgi:hypothetical protein
MITPAKAGQKKLKAMLTIANELAYAGHIKWTLSNDCFRGDFEKQGTGMAAFYDTEAALLGVSRKIGICQLPHHLQASFKKMYNGYWMVGLVEVYSQRGCSYYLTLENTFGSIILESKNDSDWTIHTFNSYHFLAD